MLTNSISTPPNSNHKLNSPIKQITFERIHVYEQTILNGVAETVTYDRREHWPHCFSIYLHLCLLFTRKTK